MRPSSRRSGPSDERPWFPDKTSRSRRLQRKGLSSGFRSASLCIGPPQRAPTRRGRLDLWGPPRVQSAGIPIGNGNCRLCPHPAWNCSLGALPSWADSWQLAQAGNPTYRAILGRDVRGRHQQLCIVEVHGILEPLELDVRLGRIRRNGCCVSTVGCGFLSVLGNSSTLRFEVSWKFESHACRRSGQADQSKRRARECSDMLGIAVAHAGRGFDRVLPNLRRPVSRIAITKPATRRETCRQDPLQEQHAGIASLRDAVEACPGRESEYPRPCSPTPPARWAPRAVA